MLKDTMTLKTAEFGEIKVPVISVNTVIVGAGAAGLKCADMLHANGVDDVAIVVDKLGNGTSNNSGSDKQTYYKMAAFGDAADSPMEFARTLYQGGMMHGDLAYLEGIGSLPAFFDLCKMGVPFPYNEYSGYVGYKTDHDPRQRGTSAGPKTSMFMFAKLLDQVRHHQIPVFDRHEAVKLLTEDEDGERKVTGVICMNRQEYFKDHYGMTVFNARNVVLATGGPGEMFKISSWPVGQIGSHGLAFEIGAVGNNLTENQHGLASIKHRWNVSGTYQQVIPDYFSTAADGKSDKRYFLHDYFDSMSHMATCIFLKGYQWPFHASRLQDGGSSLVDIAVHREIMEGRRVFMDFMNNPTPADGMEPFRIEDMDEEARTYLEKSKAFQETPYERLQHMNQRAIDLYGEHDIDLREPLEVAVCAQHTNGGLRGNNWWETNIKNLFAIGELNGTHGVRPGGSALNSGQVGASRTAQYIANVYRHAPRDFAAFQQAVGEQIKEQHDEYTTFLKAGDGDRDKGKPVTLNSIRPAIQERMSQYAAFMRSEEGINKALDEARKLYCEILENGINCPDRKSLIRATEDKFLALTSIAFLEAMKYYIENGGGSRGAFMVLDDEGELAVDSKRGRELPHRAENFDKRKEILEVKKKDNSACDFEVVPVPVRPLPEDDSWYETTWADWAAGRVFK